MLGVEIPEIPQRKRARGRARGHRPYKGGLEALKVFLISDGLEKIKNAKMS